MVRDGVDLEGKRVSIYYDDRSSHNEVAKKTGICLKDTPSKIFIENMKGYLEIIPYYKIVRIVEAEG